MNKKNTTLSILALLLASSAFSQNTWTQKTNFGGTSRFFPVSFVIQGKGYVGTGYSNKSWADFWKYDPLSDSWTQVSSMNGGVSIARHVAASFVIGNYGFVGGGVYQNQSPKSDFQKYDPFNNAWSYINQSIDNN